jgi:hypothetical protein
MNTLYFRASIWERVESMRPIGRGKKRVVGPAIVAVLFGVSLALGSTAVANTELLLHAALNGQGPYTGKAYFFRGDQFVRYDWAQNKVDEGYPRLIVGSWPGIERFPFDKMTCQVLVTGGEPPSNDCQGSTQDPVVSRANALFRVNNFDAHTTVEWSDPYCDRFSPTCVASIAANESVTIAATVYHHVTRLSTKVSATATFIGAL